MVETNRPKLAVVENGGVASAKGVHAGGIHAGFRKNPQRLDLALVEFDQPVAAAGTFTTNKFCAAPVTVSREHLGADGGAMVRAVCINSGNANAATGDEGLDAAEETCDIVAAELGCDPKQVLVRPRASLASYSTRRRSRPASRPCTTRSAQRPTRRACARREATTPRTPS